MPDPVMKFHDALDQKVQIAITEPYVLVDFELSLIDLRTGAHVTVSNDPASAAAARDAASTREVGR